jgi:hypothetical protein
LVVVTDEIVGEVRSTVTDVELVFAAGPVWELVFVPIFAKAVRKTVPCEQEVTGIEYVVPDPVTVPIEQVLAPVPEAVKSTELIPVTD